MISRRTLIQTVAAAAMLSTSVPRTARAAHAGRTIGAIRYDALYRNPFSGGSINDLAELSLPQYQDRAPSCATVVDSHTLSVTGCSTQTQIDYEITQAHNAGLDYWAFFWWNTNNTVGQSFQLFQSSTIKSQMNWCIMYGGYSFFASDVAANMTSTVNFMKQSNYQTVLSGRPLIYVLDDGTAASAMTSTISALRTACSAAGAGNPYVILMTGTVSHLATAGADALGLYSYTISRGTYSQLTTAVEAQWNTMAGLGSPMVPIAMTGWDVRPRLERPASTTVTNNTQRPYVGMKNYVSAGTPSQIATHLGNMMTWLSGHSAAAPAQTGLVYSWSEFSEGGSTLCPTLGQGNAILTALASVL